MLEREIRFFVDHYNQGRPNQGARNRLIAGRRPMSMGAIVAGECLGPRFRFYSRSAD
jgi:hypothetical protein